MSESLLDENLLRSGAHSHHSHHLTKSKKKNGDKLSTAELLLIYLINIGLIALTGWIIYYIFFHKKGNTEGEKCSRNEDCAAEHYCGGDNQCHKGTNGKAEGATCTESGDCELGLKCSAGKCSKAT